MNGVFVRCYNCQTLIPFDEYIDHLLWRHPENELYNFYKRLNTDMLYKRLEENNLIEIING